MVTEPVRQVAEHVTAEPVTAEPSARAPERAALEAALAGQLQAHLAAFEVLRARFTELTDGSVAMLGSWYGQNGLATIRAFDERAGYGLSQDTVDRLGMLYALLRDEYLGALARISGQADFYLAVIQFPAGVLPDQARDLLIAVLAEDSRPGHQDSPDWAALLARGLALLPATGAKSGYAAALPGVDPDGLRRGSGIRITGQAVHANTEIGSVPRGSTLFIVLDPDARDISGLAGGDPGSILFIPGASFTVVAIEDVVALGDQPGQRVIYLRHPGPAEGPAGAPVPHRAPSPGVMVPHLRQAEPAGSARFPVCRGRARRLHAGR